MFCLDNLFNETNKQMLSAYDDFLQDEILKGYGFPLTVESFKDRYVGNYNSIDDFAQDQYEKHMYMIKSNDLAYNYFSHFFEMDSYIDYLDKYVLYKTKDNNIFIIN